MLTLVVAFCGFFAFGREYTWFAGFVYVMYLLALTTFLNLLGKFRSMIGYTKLTTITRRVRNNASSEQPANLRSHFYVEMYDHTTPLTNH